MRARLALLPFILILAAFCLLPGARATAQEAPTTTAQDAPASAQDGAQDAPPILPTIAFHDVVDRIEDQDYDAITTIELIRFFDWLKGNGWTAVSLDDVIAARNGTRALPPKAVLLTFDDGYESVYRRIFPLLLAYRFPAVIALEGTWMEGAPGDTVSPGATVSYGGRQVPRSDFLTWPQVREMAASGLIEIASHTYNLHREVLANPQGNQRAAAATWIYDPATGRYESDAAYRQRLHDDFEQARRQITQELGKPPRALVWPYGRFTAIAHDEARKAGFSEFLTLVEGGSELTQDNINRIYVGNRPRLPDIVATLEPAPRWVQSTRIACLTLDRLAAAVDAEAQNAELGRMIDAVYALGADTVILDAAPSGSGTSSLINTSSPASAAAPLGPVYFPTTLRPLARDILGRAAWQMRVRTGAQIYLRLPLTAARAAVGDAAIGPLYRDMLKQSAADGLVLEATPGLMTIGDPRTAFGAWRPSDSRRARDGIDLDAAGLNDADRAAIAALHGAIAAQPQLKLILAVPPGRPLPATLPPIANMLLLPPARDLAANRALARRLRAAHWFDLAVSGRVVFTVPPVTVLAGGTGTGATATDETAAAVQAIRDAQVEGAAGFALCPNDPADDLLRDGAAAERAVLATAFSSASYPFKP